MSGSEEMTELEFHMWRADQMMDMIADLARRLGQDDFADDIIQWNNKHVPPEAKRLLAEQGDKK